MKNKTKKSEYDHFSSLSSEWWSKKGKFKILHDIQINRINYVKNTLKKNKLNNIEILDLGCGGGIVSEGLSMLGANVTGIDFVKDNITIAKKHADKSDLNIKYIHKNFETEKIESQYDVVILFEVLEHLNDWEKFLIKIKSNIKKNGILIISTINRNLFSKILTIDIGENVLKWIPKNTHNYYKYIKPKELEEFLKKNDFGDIKFKGLSYDLFKLKWQITENKKINFFCSCKLN